MFPYILDFVMHSVTVYPDFNSNFLICCFRFTFSNLICIFFYLKNDFSSKIFVNFYKELIVILIIFLFYHEIY